MWKLILQFWLHAGQALHPTPAESGIRTAKYEVPKAEIGMSQKEEEDWQWILAEPESEVFLFDLDKRLPNPKSTLKVSGPCWSPPARYDD